MCSNVCAQSFSPIRLFSTLWTVAHQSIGQSPVHGILQARILERVAISSSRGSSQPRDQTHMSCVSSIARWILYHCATWQDPVVNIFRIKYIFYWFHQSCILFSLFIYSATECFLLLFWKLFLFPSLALLSIFQGLRDICIFCTISPIAWDDLIKTRRDLDRPGLEAWL